MRLFSSCKKLSISDKAILDGVNAPVAVCLGNFDGMHLGHQAIFSRLFQESGKQAFKVLMTFSPHPKVVLGGAKQAEMQLLTPLRAKVALAAKFGFDAVYIVKFTRALAELEPEEFLAQYFSRIMKPKLVVVGSDWCFGRGRRGRASTLVELSGKFGFRAEVVEDVCNSEESRVSSTLIREAIGRGELERAREFLGRPFSIYGKVVRGAGRGGKIGFHTANLQAAGYLCPPNGVYAMRAKIAGTDRIYDAVANIGVRPTFNNSGRSVEIHLLDYHGEFGDNFYGHYMNAEFYSFIRPESKFSSVDALSEQIKKDIISAQTILANWTK